MGRDDRPKAQASSDGRGKAADGRHSGRASSRGGSRDSAHPYQRSSPSSRSGSGSASHPSLSPSLKEGRGKQQGNPLACGPPQGKKTKFEYSFASTAGDSFGANFSPFSTAEEEHGRLPPAKEQRTGVVGVSTAAARPARVVPSAPLSQRRDAQTIARAPAQPTIDKAGRWTDDEAEFDEGFALRVGREEQEVQPPRQPKKAKAKKARTTDDPSSPSSRVKSIAALLDNVAPSDAPPATSNGAHPNANKTRLTESQRARAKLVRDGWVKAEGLSAKDANSRWVAILSAAGWNGEVALLVAKHFVGAGGSMKKMTGAARDGATTDPLALQSYSYSVASTPTPTAGDADSATDASPSTPPATSGSSGGVPPRPISPPARASTLERRRLLSSSSPSPAYFNPFLALAATDPSPASTLPSLPASTAGNAVPDGKLDRTATDGAVPDTLSRTTTATTAAAPSHSDLPATSPSPAGAPSDRSLSTRAIRVLQQLALADLAPEAMLDIVDAFHADAQTAEVFLALEGQVLRAMWVRRRAARSSARGSGPEV